MKVLNNYESFVELQAIQGHDKVLTLDHRLRIQLLRIVKNLFFNEIK